MRKLLLAATVCASLFVSVLPAQASYSVGVFRADATAESPLAVDFATSEAGDLTIYLRGTEKGFTVHIEGVDVPVSCSMQSNRFKEAFCTIPAAPVGSYEVSGVPNGNKVMDLTGTLTGNMVGPV